MSQENVETVRRVYALRADAAGIARGDYDDIFRDYFDPEYEVVPPSAYPDAESSYRGREALRRWFQKMDEIWDDFRMQPERFFGCGRASHRFRPRYGDRQAKRSRAWDLFGARPDAQGRADHTNGHLPGPRRGPRSRRAAGVGDVAGGCRHDPPRLRG